eukprot:624859-Pelagomonas_calceolata.AAC.5
MASKAQPHTSFVSCPAGLTNHCVTHLFMHRPPARGPAGGCHWTRGGPIRPQLRAPYPDRGKD